MAVWPPWASGADEHHFLPVHDRDGVAASLVPVHYVPRPVPQDELREVGVHPGVVDGSGQLLRGRVRTLGTDREPILTDDPTVGKGSPG